jgi:GntR family transcriptional regulator/MocR family aminotransferase
MAIWRRLSERVWRDEGSALLGYGESGGERRLRTAIARHLALARGIHCEVEQIVITEGAQDALMLCIHLLCDPGDSAWVEEPGYNGAKSAFLAAGLQVKGIPVDEEGMTLAADGNAAAHYLYLAFASISAGLCNECCPTFADSGRGYTRRKLDHRR